MRGVTWRAVPAKFKTGMCEMNMLGSEEFCFDMPTLKALAFAMPTMH